MIVTEAEAATKWCPFARVYALEQTQDGDGRVYNAAASFNRHDTAGLPGGATCVGARCMAWRWHRQPVPTGLPQPPDPPDGFCGLAYSVRLP